ncbi:uncharacterized protein [Rutidosis leptorrhynchoides]|uniref:uncharacterized protein n=1 Tax=Rutidosis leptorrhynchoides TaxID=125765 RepID=UPI003A9906E4
MPRPGPRPFECVRRSWHSDRHQPVRGSIIQQIFKLVHENHSPGTKKNREWQEKLPVVVLKSEEIMYSKANSEAEYVDPETLWDRMNDAIDTIIRKDEANETGEFLPPCVEAALNLGCVPVKSSRSQRNTNTRNYLSPRNQDSSPNVQRPNVVDRTSTISEADKNVRPNLTVNPPGSSFRPPSFENSPVQMMSFENRPSSVYPLYQGFHFQPQNHQNSNKIIVGTPVFQAAREPLPSSSQTGCPERLFLFDKEYKGSKNESQPKLVECDLSLRLGLVSSDRKEVTHVDHVDLYRKSSESSLRNKEFSFFPMNSEAVEGDKTVKDVRKRKTVGELQHFSSLDPDFERMKRRGL